MYVSYFLSLKQEDRDLLHADFYTIETVVFSRFECRLDMSPNCLKDDITAGAIFINSPTTMATSSANACTSAWPEFTNCLSNFRIRRYTVVAESRGDNG